MFGAVMFVFPAGRGPGASTEESTGKGVNDFFALHSEEVWS